MVQASTAGRFADKTVVITGGTTGIGFATAQRFLAEGANVLITGQSDARVEAAVQELANGVIGFRADVRSLHDLDLLATSIKETFGSVDVLFANAGVGTFQTIDCVEEANFDFQFDINVKGLFFTVQKLLPLMGSGGSIILNCSAVHSKGLATASVYAATKAAVRSLCRSMAMELGPQGIRVNTVSPGLIPTAFQAKMGMTPEAFSGFEGFVKQAAPLGRVGAAEEVASAVLYLADSESSYVTAADLLVDGGYMSV